MLFVVPRFIYRNELNFTQCEAIATFQPDQRDQDLLKAD